MAYRNSEAYDFELFEPKRRVGQAPRKKAKIIELPQEKLEGKRRKRIGLKTILPVFLSFLIIAGLGGSYVYGQVQLSELAQSLGTEDKTLQEQRNAFAQLQMKSGSLISTEAVENYAEDKLGMKKTTRNQVASVELSKGDKSQVVQKDAGSGRLKQIWEKVKEYLS